MGIDLGVKCPAVAVTSNGKTKFYGNGRQNKQKRRKFAAKRKKLGKAKKLKAIKKSRNKEQRWMTDQDHKISRAIVNDAVVNGVKPSNWRSFPASANRQEQAVKTITAFIVGVSIV